MCRAPWLGQFDRTDSRKFRNSSQSEFFPYRTVFSKYLAYSLRLSNQFWNFFKVFNARREIQDDREKTFRHILTKLPELQLPLEIYGERLANILYAILHWCKEERVFCSSTVGAEHIAALFVHFFNGSIGARCESESKPVFYMDSVDELKTADADNENVHVLTSSGCLVLAFVKFLASERFRIRNVSDLANIPIFRCLYDRRRDWAYLHSVAFKTYHHIAWTANFKSLHILSKDFWRKMFVSRNFVNFLVFFIAPSVGAPFSLKWDRDELDPIPINIPEKVNKSMQEACMMLKSWSGMDEVNMRRVTDPEF